VHAPVILAWLLAAPLASGDLPRDATFDGGIADGSADASGGIDGGPAADARPSPAPETARPKLVKLEGTVLARGTRQPLPGALVQIGVGEASASTESGAGGKFSVDVPPGTHPLRIQCPGYAPLLRQVTVPSQEIIARLEPRETGERYETVVIAARDEAPVIPIRQDELIHTAGSFGDPFRMIDSLPGVAQTTWPLPLYAIRGANPGNTGFFIDGVRAPALFHFALGPSVIHPFFIEKLDFYPGGYPVDFGRYVSGIVSAETASPATDRLHISADVRLFDAGGIAAMPFDHGKGTVAVAGRYSYTGLILSAFSNAYSVDYWDYQARIEHTLGPGKLTLFAFGSGDNLTQKQPDVTDWGYVGQPNAIAPGLGKLMFHRVQLRWAGNFAKGRLTAAVVGGIDDSTVSVTSVFSQPFGSRSYTLAPRISERWSLASWIDVEVGGDAEFQRFRPTSLVQLYGGLLTTIYNQDLLQDRDLLSTGVFTGLTLRLGSRVVISPGLRYDSYFEQGTQASLPSPRLLIRYRVAENNWIKVTGGQFSQMPSLPVGVPGFEGFGLRSYGLQRSRQTSLGFESELEDLLGIDLNLDTSVFYQRLHLTDLRNTLLPDPLASDLVEPREGESYGWEVMLRRPMKHKLYGWLAYTVSRSLRVVDGIIVPSDWDQRHILNLVVGWRLPRNYSTSVRFHYNSGRPYPLYSSHNGDVIGYTHLADFPQLDLRADKRFIFDRWILDAYVELVNATLSKQVYDLKQNEQGATVESSYRLVLPSIGVHAEW